MFKLTLSLSKVNNEWVARITVTTLEGPHIGERQATYVHKDKALAMRYAMTWAHDWIPLPD